MVHIPAELPSGLDPRLTPAINEFGFRLMSELGKELPGKNLFISPASIAIALAMTYNGARGQTQSEMARTLGVEGMNVAEVNTAFAALRTIQEALDPKVRLAVANSLWAAPQEQLREEFVAACAEAYAAQARNVDFSDGALAAKEINAWVEDKTEQMIKDLVKPIDVFNASLVLVNAIYFKGIWQDQFDPAHTFDDDFRLLDGTTKPLPMMSRSGDLLAYQDRRIQAVNLPYGDGRIGMAIVLPAPGSDFDAFRDQFDAGALQDLAGKLRPVEGAIRLPRFKVAFGVQSLAVALQALGMVKPFTDADFSGMAPIGLYISDVLHKAVMEVNEEGTEAAAATAVVMPRGRPLQGFRMVVDRPFFCAIRDNVTGLNLFTGFIVSPE